MAVQLWEEQIPKPEKPELTNTIWAIAHNPNGDTFVVAVGDRVLLYESSSFSLKRPLKGHAGIVYCLAFSRDGKQFASGGADKTVIIWKANGDAEKKYTHNNSVQCLSFNPVIQNLASGSLDEVKIYQTDQKNVDKTKIPARALCMDWSPDGQILAIGLFSGAVLIRDKQGAELGEIKRTGPAWCLQFNPVKFETTDNTLTIGCWGEGISQFKIAGNNTYTNLGNDKPLKGFDPTVINFYASGEVFALGGSNGAVNLYTKEAIEIGPICKYDDWVWALSTKCSQHLVISGTNTGVLKAHQAVFPTVHGLYKDRYSYRDQLTDAIIQHLVTDNRVRIRCRDYIKKIALYKERLAIQLSDKIIVYGVSAEDEFDMKYKALKKIGYKGECSLLLVGYNNIVICHERKMKLVGFSGEQELEWNFDSFIRFAKIVGGPAGRETVLVGLRNGEVLKIFADNPFPVQLVKIASSIRCVDISLDKKRLAVVDEHLNLFVYNLETKDVVYQDTKVTSVAWNTDLEDVLAYSNDSNILSIKTADFPPVTQKLTGIIVGFKNSKVFVLQGGVMNTIDVPQTGTLFRFIESKLFAKAYQIACLGVTEQDWKTLAFEALQNKQFDIARKAFVRLKDLKYIDLVNKVEKDSKAGTPDVSIQGEILACQGNYKEAANALIKGGQSKKAIELYVELKKWEEAKELVKKVEKMAKASGESGSKMGDGAFWQDLYIGQAESAKDNGDAKTAAELFLAAGETRKAIETYGEHSMLEPLNEICKGLDKKTQEDMILLCGKYFKEKKNYGFAKEAYLRLGDLKALIELNVSFQKWNEGVYLAKQNPDLSPLLYLPYAEFLVKQGKYDQAQEAYKRASRIDLALKILDSLAHNAIVERRYKDGAYYYWKQALETLIQVKSAAGKEAELMQNFETLKRMSYIYYAYDLVNKYLEEPFQDVIGGALYYNCVFNAACFLLNIIGKMNPLNISKVYLYYTIGKLGSQQEAYWTARNAFEKLQSMKIPIEWQTAIELEALKIKAMPFTDKEGISPVCNRCMNANHLVTYNDDKCTFCGHPFIRSFISFDTMPLVEFRPAKAITHIKAMTLIKTDHPSKKKVAAPENADGWQEKVTDNQQTLSVAAMGGDASNDLFLQKINDSPELTGPESYAPIEVDTKLLESMKLEEVFVEDLTEYCAKYTRRYLKNMVPDIPLTQCEKCSNIFLLDEYEFAFLEKKCCPFCRYTSADQLMEDTSSI